ncbi:MAG: GntR family transcriptional regulator [Hyphomicrobiales bacterium]|nr:GntR family transcriptional regulator [Hyphomicrobiales bacterium]
MLMIADTRLALQAYEKILDLIMSGTLKPGALIQERKLAEHLAMSRTPLRDALLMLEGEGLLVRQQGRGLQVKLLALEDFMENLYIRRQLEPEAARAAAGRIPDAVLADLAGRLDGLIGEARSGTAPDRALAREVDNDLHDLIADAAGNRQMAAIVRNLRRQTVMFDLRSVPERLEATCAEHLALVAALRQGAGDAAADAMRRHLDGVRQSIVRRLAGL